MPAATFYSSTPIFEKVIKKLEQPLVNMFALASKWLPKPTKETTNKHNAHILIDIRDSLLPRWNQGELRNRAYLGMFNFLISKYDRDDVNGGYLDEIVREIKNSDWIFKQAMTPQQRRAYIAKALDNKEFPKAMQVID